jgi:hypothetical protein
MMFSQTLISHLLKVPHLIGHFVNHQKKARVSFIEFLGDHYLTDHNDDDQSEDEQLPFKNISYHQMGYAIMPDLNLATEVMQYPMNRKTSFAQSFMPKQSFAGVFHPPRL